MADDTPDGYEWVEGVAFGHRFKELRGNLEDLIVLEREGAIYSHFWDEETEAFRYYRIKFLPKEIFEYVEAHIARQEFLEAQWSGASFEEALAAISNEEIRQRVLSFGNYGRMKMKDGTEMDIRGCAASFYTSEMEKLVCGQRRDRYELLPEISIHDHAAFVIAAIDSFPVIKRFLANRKHGRPAIAIENEYDVQDLLFCLLRSVFHDARLEDWTPKHAGSAKRIDIVLPTQRVIVETKYVRDASHARSVADELKVDIESYHAHPSCGTLIAFVLDPAQHIVDPDQIMTDLSGRRTKGRSSFDVRVLVR